MLLKVRDADYCRMGGGGPGGEGDNCNLHTQEYSVEGIFALNPRLSLIAWKQVKLLHSSDSSTRFSAPESYPRFYSNLILNSRSYSKDNVNQR